MLIHGSEGLGPSMLGHLPEIAREVWPGILFKEVGKGEELLHTFNGGGLTYYGVSGLISAGGEWRINGNATAHTLSCTTFWCDLPLEVCDVPVGAGPDAIMTVEEGSVQTIESWRVYGDSTLPLVVRSSSPGEAWTLECAAPYACASDYIILSDSTCTGTTPCYAGSHSVDGGGNANWVFTDPPPPPTTTSTTSTTSTSTSTTTTTTTTVPPPPQCCAFSGSNPFGATCIDTAIIGAPMSAEVCDVISELHLAGDPTIHFNPNANCSPNAGDGTGVCVTP